MATIPSVHFLSLQRLSSELYEHKPEWHFACLLTFYCKRKIWQYRKPILSPHMAKEKGGSKQPWSGCHCPDSPRNWKYNLRIEMEIGLSVPTMRRDVPAVLLELSLWSPLLLKRLSNSSSIKAMNTIFWNFLKRLFWL